MKGDIYSGLVFEQKKGIRFSNDEEELIKENVKRIIKTRKGERVGEPNFGSDALTLLFLPQIKIYDLMEVIKRDVEAQEPRVTVKSITLIPSSNKEFEDSLDIELVISVNNKESTVSIGV